MTMDFAYAKPKPGVIYCIEPKTRTVRLKKGYYQREGEYWYGIVKDRCMWWLIDVWTGMPITWGGDTIAAAAERFTSICDRLPGIFRQDKINVDGWNSLIKSSIPLEADLPRGVYDYIFGPAPFRPCYC